MYKFDNLIHFGIAGLPYTELFVENFKVFYSLPLHDQLSVLSQCSQHFIINIDGYYDHRGDNEWLTPNDIVITENILSELKSHWVMFQFQVFVESVNNLNPTLDVYGIVSVEADKNFDIILGGKDKYLFDHEFSVIKKAILVRGINPDFQYNYINEYVLYNVNNGYLNKLADLNFIYK